MKFLQGTQKKRVFDGFGAQLLLRFLMRVRTVCNFGGLWLMLVTSFSLFPMFFLFWNHLCSR